MATAAAAAAAAPEHTLYGSPFILGAARPQLVVAPSSHPFLELLDAGFNSPVPEAVRDRRIDALGPDPCLDFFFQVQPGTSPQRVCDLLAAAWAHAPLTALKLVCNMRSVRGTVKSDMEGFYAAALWIHRHHPKTLAGNIPALAEFGYLKDLPELLLRVIQADDVRMIARDNHTKAVPAAAGAGRKRRRKASLPLLFGHGRHLWAALGRKRHRVGRKRRNSTTVDAETVASMDLAGTVASMNLLDAEMVAARELLEAEVVATGQTKLTGEMMETAILAVRALEMYCTYGDYRNLFDHIAQLFADLLRSDLQNKDLDLYSEIGLAAKCCPTPGSSFDRSTLLCEGIARRLFPRNSNTDYAHISEEEYRYHVLKRLCDEVLVPLRNILHLPERYIPANRWSELPYDRISSVMMHRYEALFKKHDKNRFETFCAAKEATKEAGKEASEEAGKTFLPHTIASMCNNGDVTESELQWCIMMRSLHDKGLVSKLRNCIAVCDVSDRMKGVPMEVGMALSVLVSELSEEPWAHKVITFSRDPKIHTIKGKSFQEKLGFVKGLKIDTKSEINLKELYNCILDTAKRSQLPNEKMVKTIFVFSNKEFDDASANPWLPDYRNSCRRFQSAGYRNVVPQIVFWNLQGPREVTFTNAGVMRLKGFSDNLLKLFLEYGGVVHAKDEMTSALSRKGYEKLSVLD